MKSAKKEDANSRGRGRPPKSIVTIEIIDPPVEVPAKVEPAKKQTKRDKAMKSPEKVAIKEKPVPKTAVKKAAVQPKAEVVKKEVNATPAKENSKTPSVSKFANTR